MTQSSEALDVLDILLDPDPEKCFTFLEDEGLARRLDLPLYPPKVRSHGPDSATDQRPL